MPAEIPAVGSARVILGSYGATRSPIDAPPFSDQPRFACHGRTSFGEVGAHRTAGRHGHRMHAEHDGADEPQGFVASVPPVVAATSDLAVIRMHGRNPARWRDRSHGRRSGVWTYRYAHDELVEWAARIRALAARTDEVHVIFSNGPVDNAVRNAQELAEMLHPAAAELAMHDRNQPSTP